MRGHVAVGVVGVWLDDGLVAIRADGRAAQAVALLGRLDQAGFVVGVSARPVAVGGLMDQLLESCRPRRTRTARCSCASPGRRRGAGRFDAELVVPGGLQAVASLADVLAACRLDQAIDGVVGVVAVRLDDLVVEVDRLLGIVADVGDVAGRVVGVAQVLQTAAGAAQRRLQVRQAEGQRVVFVGRPARRCRSRSACAGPWRRSRCR